LSEGRVVQLLIHWLAWPIRMATSSAPWAPTNRSRSMRTGAVQSGH